MKSDNSLARDAHNVSSLTTLAASYTGIHCDTSSGSYLSRNASYLEQALQAPRNSSTALSMSRPCDMTVMAPSSRSLSMYHS